MIPSSPGLSTRGLIFNGDYHVYDHLQFTPSPPGILLLQVIRFTTKPREHFKLIGRKHSVKLLK